MASSTASKPKTSVYTFGFNASGQLGFPPASPAVDRVLAPQPVPALAGHVVVQAAAGERHTLFLTDQGRVFACGENNHGQLGMGHLRAENTAKRINSLLKYTIVAVAAKGDVSMAITAAGELLSWGDGSCARLGHGGLVDGNTPKIVMDLQGHRVMQVVIGLQHCVCLTARGELFGWGTNGSKQLKVPDVEIRRPTRILEDEWDANNPPVQVALGSAFTFVLLKDGMAKAYGTTNFHFSNRISWSSTETYEVKFLAADSLYAITINGETGGIQTLGYDPFGRQGEYHSPDAIRPFAGVKAVLVVAAGDHALALTHDGTVYGQGRNQAGVLGLGDGIDRPGEPTVIEGLLGCSITGLAGGDFHTVAWTGRWSWAPEKHHLPIFTRDFKASVRTLLGLRIHAQTSPDASELSKLFDDVPIEVMHCLFEWMVSAGI